MAAKPKRIEDAEPGVANEPEVAVASGPTRKVKRVRLPNMTGGKNLKLDLPPTTDDTAAIEAFKSTYGIRSTVHKFEVAVVDVPA